MSNQGQQATEKEKTDVPTTTQAPNPAPAPTQTDAPKKAPWYSGLCSCWDRKTPELPETTLENAQNKGTDKMEQNAGNVTVEQQPQK